MSILHTIHICLRLEQISAPMDAGKYCELRFSIPPCGEIAGGGELRWRVKATDAPLWFVGDEYHMRFRRT